MRLVVDLQAAQGPSATRGIGYYAVSLTRALAAAPRGHEVVVLLDGGAPADDVLRLRARLAPVLGRDDVVLFPAPAPAVRPSCVADTEAAREAAIAALQPDVVLVSSLFELAPDAPMSIGEWCAPVPTAAVLYDLIPLTDLDLHKPDPSLRALYQRGLQRLTRADLLLSISDYSAAEARRLLPDCPPLATVHGAAPPPAGPRRPLRAPDAGFALAVGLDEPRKDIPTAVRAWAALPGEVRQGRPFVVAGAWLPEGQERLRRTAEAAGLPRDQLVFLGPVDDAELAWLYEHASLFAFPSLVEGLGLPPLEAAHLGTPAVVAASSSLVELFDEELAYAPPGDVPAWTAAMARVLTDAAARERLREAGQRAVERFTWAHTAERTWAALEGLVRPPTPHRRTAALRGDASPDVRHRLAAAYDLSDDLPERVVHLLDGDPEGHADALVAEPGVVVLPDLGSATADLSTLLAPALGVVVRTHADAVRALERGVTGAPVLVGTELAAAVEHCWTTDVATHWAGALTPGAEQPAVQDALLRRPRWSNRRRGPLLASDVTVYRSTGFLSGIQRATRRLHGVLRDEVAALGGAVVPVAFGEPVVGTPHPVIAGDPVLSAVDTVPGAADWVLCLDLDDRLPAAVDELQDARAAGTGVATNVYDLLPWAHPEWWPPRSAALSFVPWLQAAVRISDVLLVNSVATASELERFVREHPPRRVDPFEVQLLRLGADLDHAGDTQERPQRDADHLLMVGTVEPRKGHREVLDAVQRLWAQGAQVRLTVLGRAGWMVDDVVARMEALAEQQPLFSWLRNASDSVLDGLYATCTAVVLASEGEGFGLPVVEAAVRGCPVVVRDIPVLRELAGDDATYFGDGRPLTDVLDRVLREGAAVPSTDRVHTWDEVGRRLLAVLDGGVEPLARWSPSDGWAWT